MKKYILLAVAVILVLVFAINTNNSNKKSSDSQTIKLGAIISETGVAAAFGEMSHKGIALAVKEINNNGGIDGRKVEVVYEDDQTDPKVSSGLFQKVTGVNKVDAIIGSNFDFVTQPLFSLAKTNKVVVVSPSNPRIPGAFDTNEYSFVMMTEFDSIVRNLKKYLENEKYEQLGILRFESSFAEQIQTSLNDVQKEMGKKPIISETYKQIGNNDFKTQILKLKNSKVDLVFLDMIGPDPVTFINQSRQLGYSPKIITHIGIQDALAMKDIDQKILEGIVLINWNESPSVFKDKFTKEYGIIPDKSANRAYDAVYVLSEAVSKATSSESLPYTLRTKEYMTPNGSFGFNANNSAKDTPILIQKIKDGRFVMYE